MRRNVDLRRPELGAGRLALTEELVRRRLAAGLSQSELAEKMGTSQRTVSQLENLKHDPKLGTFLRWAGALGVALCTVPPEPAGDST